MLYKVVQRRVASVHGLNAGEPEATVHVNNDIRSMFIICYSLFILRHTRACD